MKYCDLLGLHMHIKVVPNVNTSFLNQHQCLFNEYYKKFSYIMCACAGPTAI